MGVGAATARARRRGLGARRRADRAGGRAVRRRGGAAGRGAGHRAAARGSGAQPPARPAHVVGVRPRGVGRVPGEVVRRAAAAARDARARPGADGPRLAGAQGPRAGDPRAGRRRGAGPRAVARGTAARAREAGRARRRLPDLPEPRAAALGAAAPGGRPRPLHRARRARAQLVPPVGLRGELRRGRGRAPAAGARRRRAAPPGADRPRRPRAGRRGHRLRLQGQVGAAGGALAPGRQAPGRALPARRPRGAGARPGRGLLPAAGRGRRAPARRDPRGRRPVAERRAQRPAGARGARRAARRVRHRGARGGRRDPRRAAGAQAGLVRVGRRLRAPDDLPVRHRMSAVAQPSALYDAAGRMLGGGAVALTEEQAAAVARRDGPLVLSANAGSGKTTVLVERFMRSVVEDGLEPGRILALTFTDRAAGGLRSRVRERFAELGEREAVRALETAWISTFHGLCARVLRANAVRAGLDPGFRVLDEAESRAVRGAAFERALAAFLDGDRPDALDLVAAYGADRVAELVTARHDELRSRGMTRPSLPVPGAATTDEAAARARLATALTAALADLSATDERATVVKARAALERCGALLAGAEVRLGDLDAACFKPGNTAALKTDACLEYLAAHAAFAAAVRNAAAVGAVALFDDLLGRYADAYAEAKRSQAAVDFDDLELLCRDLLRDAPPVREALRERFARIMVDEFQDTNAVQLELLGLLGGDRFVVGDELQSIYAFRHADVRIFRAERDRLAAAGASAELATNFRSRPAILGVVDDAFGAGHGGAHVPFAAGRDEAGQAPGPLVELLVTDIDAAVDFPAEAFATLPPAPAWRRAEARLVAQRVADLVERDGVSAGDVVVLLRSAGDVAVYERALEEQGLPTLAAGGRGYWGRQQVLDLCAYLGAVANPRDEGALLGLLASPLVGLSSDGLAVLALGARGGERWSALARAFCGGEEAAWAGDLGDGDRDLLATFCPWFAGERARAPRLGLDELIERVI